MHDTSPASPESTAPVAPIEVGVSPDMPPSAQAAATGAPDSGSSDSPAASADGTPRAGLPVHSNSLFDDVLSGRFDEAVEDATDQPARRILAPQAESPKLHKVLAQAGMGSRLEMEQLIVEGRITVNNEPAHIGQRIQFGDHVKVNGKPIRLRIDPPPPRVIAYHKPAGEVVTHDDPQNRPTVFRRLPKLQQGKWQSVGRLDLNTEGLLLFTNSGELANNLMHPRFGLQREYAVRVLGALNAEERQQLLDGVRLDDGIGQFGSISDGGGDGANCWYRVTISEGRNREVRRMFEAVGHAVSRLIRIRYGAMVLPRGLRRGAWVELDFQDIHALRSAAGMGPPAGVRDGQRQGGPREADGPNAGRRRRRGGRGGSERRPGDAGPARDPAAGPSVRANPGRGYQEPGNRFKPRPDRHDHDESAERADQRAAQSQPDPMKTAFGYIGADSFTRQRQGAGPGQGQRSGRPGPGRPRPAGNPPQRRGGRGR